MHSGPLYDRRTKRENEHGRIMKSRPLDTKGLLGPSTPIRARQEATDSSTTLCLRDIFNTCRWPTAVTPHQHMMQ